MRMCWVLWKYPKSLPLGPRCHECDNKQTKSWFCYLNLPVTLISGQKQFGCMINKWQFCAPKLAKRANYASSAFFGNTCIESYARNDELCRKLCQQNLSNPSCPPWGVWIFSGTTHCTIVSLQNNNSKWRERFLITGTHWIDRLKLKNFICH